MYETFFKLRAKPFQLNPDPAFFYGSRGHRRAMAYLEYGLHQSEGFIVITGEVGAGKTTIVRSLLEQLDPAKVVAANIVSTQVDANDMLRMVAAAFGVPSRNLDKAGLLLALETYLVSIAASGKRALLIVDEAQNLSAAAVEELRMLSNFQLEDHALLQSFLVGQPEFRDMMQRAEMQQLRQRVIASYHLGPLDSQETRGYIEHRLSHVGWTDDPIFEPAAYNVIYGYTGGIPRRINTLCDRLMLAAYIAERHSIGESDVREVIDELKQEFATPGGARPVLTDAVQADAGGAAGAAALELLGANKLALDRLRVSPELAAQAAEMAGSYDLQRIEARLAGLEQSVAATLNVLSQLLQAVRRDETAGEARE
ncbi:XrtA/PEP-CTERM system-associated ATPase [Thauera sp. WH-1]|uniref:XrtA/PEP-CTERM system-associated ATPase n=1 Tax=Thauera sp. WH-1 TaxID=3398230 RepID=UPI0039FDBA65